MKTQYGVVLGILLLSCSSLNSSLRTTYSIEEDTFDKKYYINGIERYDRFPNYKSISADEMNYFLRTEFVEEDDSVKWKNTIRVGHSYHYQRTKKDTTGSYKDIVELEDSDNAFINYIDFYSEYAPVNLCCKIWEYFDIILPAYYLDEVDRNKSMLVKLRDTEKRYEWIITITPEMIANQEEGLKALRKQLDLEKDDGKVNVIRQTQF